MNKYISKFEEKSYSWLIWGLITIGFILSGWLYGFKKSPFLYGLWLVLLLLSFYLLIFMGQARVKKLKKRSSIDFLTDVRHKTWKSFLTSFLLLLPTGLLVSFSLQAVIPTRQLQSLLAIVFIGFCYAYLFSPAWNIWQQKKR